MTATSSFTRATAAGQTFIISACAAFGSRAMVSDMRQCAWLTKSSSVARSARSLTIFAIVAFVSFSLPLSPRLLNFFQTFSRRSRRVENVRNGSTLDRVFRIAHLPESPRSSAAAFAAETIEPGSPARSASCSSTVQVFSSARTFARNSENNVASCWLISDSRFFWLSSRRAPRRTNDS